MSTPVSQGSIRQRLLVLLLIGAAALAILLYVVVQSVAQQVARESQDNVLASSARSVLDSARSIGGQINIDLPYAALSMLDSVTDERVFYAIHLDGEVLTGYADLPRNATRPGGETAFLSAQYLGEEIRVASMRRPVSTDLGQAILEVSVAQTLSGQRQMLARISQLSVVLGAGFFLLSAALAMVVARSTIRPLDRLTASVSRRGPKDLRPVAAPVPSEMVPLVASLNSFMGRLQTSLTRSEEFIADAAHRVRTPLAIVRTKAEIIQRSIHKPENQRAMREMIHAIDESSRTAGQLLDHAMVSFRLDHLDREEVDLPSLIRDTVARLRPLTEMQDISLNIHRCDAATLPGDPILLQSALVNLLDNAIKYCPEGAQIDLELHHADDQIALIVRDTGPGFPKAARETLTARFARGQNAQGVVGSGLGLTIVQEVVQAHGGHMAIDNTPEGGACVTLFFPV